MSDNLQADLEKYAKAELKKSAYIKKEEYRAVLDFLLAKTDIIKSGNYLTLADNKALGLNTRRKISREAVNLLNDEGLKLYNLVGYVLDMWCSTRSKASLHQNLERVRRNGLVKKFVMLSSNGIDDCMWCRSNQEIEFAVSDAPPVFEQRTGVRD
jgi:hypothetical protein